MRLQEKPYIPTSEDYIFIYQLFGKEGSSIQWMEHMLKVWEYEVGPIYLNKKPLNKESLQEFIDSGCKNPPNIDFKHDSFWSMIFHRDKKFIFSLHQYLQPKGFDLLEEFSHMIAYKKDKNPYRFWCLLPNYIACLGKPDSNHQPLAKNLFTSIDWLSEVKKKYSCSAAIGLLTYAAENPKIYDYKKTIDLFTKFTNNTKSIPKNQIKKYEDLLKMLEKLDKEYLESKIKENPELRKRIEKKDSISYEIQDGIIRKWTFDVHNLAIKNGNFNVKYMKDNFDKLNLIIQQYLAQQIEVIQFDYQNNDAIITIYLLVEHTNEGKEQVNKIQEIIDIVFDHCVDSYNLTNNEIKKIWENLLLVKSLEKNLLVKEKNIQKITKI
jgi:hypothetical protein